MRKGERIELVELDDGFGDGWYLGKDLRTGITGLFPGGVWFALFCTVAEGFADMANCSP